MTIVGKENGMNEWWASLSSFERVFAICAVAGGTGFAIRTIMFFLGMAGDMETDGVGLGGEGLGDSDVSFHFLSLHGITAFFLMFGVTGFLMLRGDAVRPWVAVAGSVVVGLGTMALVVWMLRGLRRLQSEGTLRPEDAVGQEGVVYLRVQPGGTGKIQVTLQGRLRIFEARGRDPQASFQTGDRVRVVEVTPEHLMIVEKR